MAQKKVTTSYSGENRKKYKEGRIAKDLKLKTVGVSKKCDRLKRRLKSFGVRAEDALGLSTLRKMLHPYLKLK